MSNDNTTSKRKRMGLAAVLTAILLVFIFTLAPAPPDTAAATNVHPALLAMAAEQPDSPVRVIIQKSSLEADIAAAVTQLGGQVIKDLHIINAIVAKMEAEAAVDLGFDASVNWVSLDGQVVETGRPPKGGDDTNPPNTFLDTLGVPDVWAMGYDGSGIGIAVIDSGVSNDSDFANEMEYRIELSASRRR